jgi:osmotically-inducible protein OsmY
MSLDDELRQDVRDELEREPSVDPDVVAVSVRDGCVALRGAVGSPREKREAAEAAARVRGVVAVDNELEVRLPTEQRREDAALRADILQALMLDGAVPETVDARVEGGSVTLTGSARWPYQREDAELVAANVGGTADVLDAIELQHPPAPDAAAVKKAIGHALRRSASLDGDGLHVSASEGTVTIRGHVRSWAEHDDALAAAWGTPGVAAVRDRIAVTYSPTRPRTGSNARRDELARTFVLASATNPHAAARAAAEAPHPIDLVVRSPSEPARAASAIAVGGRWVFTVDEPLLAPRGPGETGGRVIARLVMALRGLPAYEARAPLVVFDGLDLLGAGVFVLDEKGVMRCADDLEQLLPLP